MSARTLGKVLVACCAAWVVLKLCGCANCYSPAARTVEQVAQHGLDAERDGRLLACRVGEDWVVGARLGNVNG